MTDDQIFDFTKDLNPYFRLSLFVNMPDVIPDNSTTSNKTSNASLPQPPPASLKISYGNVRNKIPTYDVTHTMGIALIVGIVFITIILAVISTITGVYFYRRIKRRNLKVPDRNHDASNQDEVLTQLSESEDIEMLN